MLCFGATTVFVIISDAFFSNELFRDYCSFLANLFCSAVSSYSKQITSIHSCHNLAIDSTF